MAVTLKQKHASQKARKREASTTWIAEGSDDIEDVDEAAWAVVPSTFMGLPLQEIEIEEAGDSRWEVTARYAPDTEQNQQDPVPPPQVGESEFAFNTTGEVAHITQALDTTIYPHPDVGGASDWGGAIGVRDGAVDGVDIVVPRLGYEETHYVAHATISSLVGTLYSLTGKVNNSTFRDFAAGEVLFLGASGRRRRSEQFWQITLQFAIAPNGTGLTVGEITGINKKGHEYLEVEYEMSEDEDSHTFTTKPFAVRVHQVYEVGDFSVLPSVS